MAAHTLPIPNHDRINNYFSWKGRDMNAVQSHTLIWKYQLDFQSINENVLFRADNFAFEFNKYNYRSKFKPTDMVKECGICPLYTKEKDHNGVKYLNDIEEPSRSNAS